MTSARLRSSKVCMLLYLFKKHSVCKFFLWQLYSAVLCFLADPLCSSCMQLCMSKCSITLCIFQYPPKQCTYSVVCYMVGAMWNCCCFGTCSACAIPQLKAKCVVYMCLAVTCHWRFWQNDQDLVHVQIRVSTESWHWRRKVSCHPCGISIKRPMLLPLCYSCYLHYSLFFVCFVFKLYDEVDMPYTYGGHTDT